MWEYNVIGLFNVKDYNGNINEDDLNRQGKEGWELVQIVGDDVIFKRKAEEEQ